MCMCVLLHACICELVMPFNSPLRTGVMEQAGGVGKLGSILRKDLKSVDYTSILFWKEHSSLLQVKMLTALFF